MVINIFLFILILVRLATGLRLLVTGRKNKLSNLLWLSVSMFVAIVILLFGPVDGNPLAALPFSLFVFTISTILGQVPLILFNQQTFYKDRKSPIKWVWAIFIILSIMAIYGAVVSESNFKQSIWLALSLRGAALVWAWHGLLAYQALRKIASEKTVEDWVKARYQLIVVYSIAIVLGAFTSIVRSFLADGGLQSPLGGLMAIISLLTQIVSVVLLFLVWAMPEAFRLWLNRNYQTRLDEETHEQALAIMDILGTSMTKGTKLPKTLALVGIRQTIGREINTEDSKKIESHVIGLGYDDWSRFLNNPELHVFFREVANVSPRDVVENARQALIENQSIFTLQAK